MKLRKNEIRLEYIAGQLLDECPPDASSAFQDGYLDLIQAFFLHLDCCSAPFINDDGSFEVDLHFVTESSFDIIQNLVSKKEVEQVKDYWLGVMTAFPLAEMKIKLAYEFPCDSAVA